MKYFMINGTFQENRPEGAAFKACLDAHHAYMAPFIENGSILTCGHKAGGGGILVVRAESREAIDQFIANDPFVKAGVQKYTIEEFHIFAIQDYAKQWKL